MAYRGSQKDHGPFCTCLSRVGSNAWADFEHRPADLCARRWFPGISVNKGRTCYRHSPLVVRTRSVLGSIPFFHDTREAPLSTRHQGPKRSRIDPLPLVPCNCRSTLLLFLKTFSGAFGIGELKSFEESKRAVLSFTAVSLLISLCSGLCALQANNTQVAVGKTCPHYPIFGQSHFLAG